MSSEDSLSSASPAADCDWPDVEPDVDPVDPDDADPDEPDDADPEDSDDVEDPDDGEEPSLSSAAATPAPAMIAAPTPSATANEPIRPTYDPAPMGDILTLPNLT